jgi:hypothetical protein
MRLACGIRSSGWKIAAADAQPGIGKFFAQIFRLPAPPICRRARCVAVPIRHPQKL